MNILWESYYTLEDDRNYALLKQMEPIEYKPKTVGECRILFNANHF